MDEQLLTILKLCLLALLYLFFLRVLRAVWVEIRGPKVVEGRSRRGGPALAGTGPGASAAPLPAAAAPRASAPAGGRKARRAAGPAHLVVVEPPQQRGRRYDLADEVTVGRAAGCQVTIDDTYASQLHARVFSRDGQLFVEDLGSTNGTFLNRKKVQGPQVLHRGDRLQVGNTVLELA